MNRIGTILDEMKDLNQQKFAAESMLNKVNSRIVELTREWQQLCSHPVEYMDELDSGQIKCIACSHIINAGEME